MRRALASRAAGKGSLACVRCAEEALARGEDSPALRMLAGADLPDGDATNPQVEEYVAALFAAQNATPPTAAESLAEYARMLAAQIVDGAVTPLVGARRLYELFVAAGCADSLSQWNYLDDSVSLAQQGVFNMADVEAEILESARALLAIPSNDQT